MTLQIQFQLFADNNGVIGESIDSVVAGSSFYAQILVGDFRSDATGLIGFLSSLQWDPRLIQSLDDPFLAEDVITSSFPVLADGTLDNTSGLISDLTAGALPEFDFGQAIGINQLGIFAMLRFLSISSAPITTSDFLLVPKPSNLAFADDYINLPPLIAKSLEPLQENSDAIPLQISDPNIGDTITLVISGGIDQSLFTIDSLTKELRFKEKPDFETPLDSDQDNVYEVEIIALDNFGQPATEQLRGRSKSLIKIQVNNINEIPQFISPTILHVAENTININTIKAFDPDIGTILNYSLIGGDDQFLFEIDPLTGALNFKQNQDFENPDDADKNNQYKLSIQVSDGININTQDFIVVVEDTNDEFPVLMTPKLFFVPENNVDVGTIKAVDPDQNTILTYNLIDSADQLYFNLDPITGFLSFKNKPDFESPNDSDYDNKYDLVIQVNDGINTITENVKVYVLDVVDETPPNTSPKAIFLTNSINQIAENSEIKGGIKIADINIDDDGKSINNLILNGVDSNNFEIRDRSLFFIGANLDFETQKTYQIKISVDDITVGSTPDASLDFILTVTNLPDHLLNDPIQFKNNSLTYDLSNTINQVKVNAEDDVLNQTEALFHNLFGLYSLENIDGGILDTFDLNGNGLKDDLLYPGDRGYAKTAISNRVNNFILQAGADGNPSNNTNAEKFGDILLEGGKFYAPFVITNGGNLIPSDGNIHDAFSTFLTINPDNAPANLDNFKNHAVAYFSFGKANPDGTEHLQNRGNNTFGFEDLPGNLGISDFDFNDVVFKFNFFN